jgi:hypothetical protein
VLHHCIQCDTFTARFYNAVPTTAVSVDVETLTKALEKLRAFNRVLVTNRRVSGREAWLPLQVNKTMQNLIKAYRAIQMVR